MERASLRKSSPLPPFPIMLACSSVDSFVDVLRKRALETAQGTDEALAAVGYHWYPTRGPCLSVERVTERIEEDRSTIPRVSSLPCVFTEDRGAGKRNCAAARATPRPDLPRTQSALRSRHHHLFARATWAATAHHPATSSHTGPDMTSQMRVVLICEREHRGKRACSERTCMRHTSSYLYHPAVGESAPRSCKDDAADDLVWKTRTLMGACCAGGSVTNVKSIRPTSRTRSAASSSTRSRSARSLTQADASTIDAGFPSGALIPRWKRQPSELGRPSRARFACRRQDTSCKRATPVAELP